MNLDIEVGDTIGKVSGLLLRPPDAWATYVLAHGAGAGMRHRFMESIAQALAERGIATLRYQFPYVEAGTRRPDPPGVLEAAVRAAVAKARELAPELPVVAGGKSLGGRMASMLAAEDPEEFRAAALVFFGYPLHPPGRPDKPRVEHLAQIRVPMLFIQGTADSLASFPMIQDVVRGLGSLARLHVIEGGDHSFRAKGKRRPDEEIGQELGEVAATFIKEAVA